MSSAPTEAARAAHVSHAPGLRPTMRTAAWLAFAAFLVYAATGGGRIVSSDELTMLEVSRALLRGGIAVPEGATLRGPDGRDYSKNAAGQAVLALPLVAVAGVASRAAPLDAARRELAVRFVVSFFNAVVTAVLLAVFYAGARRLGAPRGAALVATLMLGFATPLWVYSKSFMAEPLQALGLLMAALGAAFALDPRKPRAPWLAAAGVLVAVSVKLSMLPLALAALVPMIVAPRRAWGIAALGLGSALAGHAVYNVARFGTPFETGYGAQATAAAYTTPVLVGLYGLLLSPGKGAFWFAPPLWLAPGGLRSMIARARSAGARRLAAPTERAVWSAAAAWAAGLLLYSRFEHWAGDGSFGPRYLIPILPLAFLGLAFALERARGTIRSLAFVLAIAGVLVQIGGISIYFGAQMREVGDYPYRLPLDDPRFMSDSRWNPRFSPIADHWRMLIRNAGEHLAGEAPRLGVKAETAPGTAVADSASAANTTARLGIGAAEQAALLHAIDFWWLYLGYAGLPRAPVWAALLMIVALAGFAGVRAHRAWRREGEAE